MNLNTIYNMDCLTGLKALPDNSVNTCVTSPPYWGLRDYGVNGQIGLEVTLEEYVGKMVEIFREVRRVLRDDGTLWLNLGDSYSFTKPKPKQENWINTAAALNWSNEQSKKTVELPPKNLVGIPWRVAFALQADGWYLRSDIIWSKPNPMPESVTDRPTKAHEYMFLLSKSAKYYYDINSIKEPIADSTIGRGKVVFGGNKGRNYKPTQEVPNYRAGSEQWGRTFDYKESCKNGRNKRTVWTVSTKPFSEAHFATFPPELIKPCILAGCPEGGIVLDPFIGAGTTAIVAYQQKRNYLGIELNPDYCAIAEKRIQKEAKKIESLGVPLFKQLENGGW